MDNKKEILIKGVNVMAEKVTLVNKLWSYRVSPHVQLMDCYTTFNIDVTEQRDLYGRNTSH